MRSAIIVVFLVAGALGCQGKSGAVSSAYRTDIENICDAEARSGALAPEEDPNRRSLVVAQWMARTIQSDEGRRFLGRLAQLAPAEKGRALRSEAARVGLTDCALAASWR